MDAVEIQGRTITFPVEIRHADSWAAIYAVPAARAQAVIADTGFRVFRVAGRAFVVLTFVRYADGDLDVYNEVGLVFIVRALRGGRAPRAYVHRLPVNRTFTLEAGRTIWGYPKTLADIDIDERRDHARCTLDADGQRVLTLTIREGIVPTSTQAPPTYTRADGVVRETRWTIDGGRARNRIGGARLALGSHPIADELRALGLPKRAFVTSTIRGLRGRFSPPAVIGD